jgi:predicted permease
MPRFIHLPLTSRAAVSADVDDEIRAHLEERVRQLVDSGMPLDDARRIALQRFGDVEATRRSMRESAQRHARRLRRRDQLSGLAQDLRHTLRQLRRSPGLTAVIVVTLGLGIGATATMFGLVDRLLLRPPAHVVEPDRLGRIYTSHLDGDNRAVDQDEISYLRFTQLRDGANAVADVAGMANLSVLIGRGATSRRAMGGFVTANFWSVLGVRPALGRFFESGEDRPPDGTNVVVLGHAFWRTVFNADTTALGRAIDVGDRRFTIVGVAPRDFHGVMSSRVDVWLPATSVRAKERSLPANWYARNSFWWLELVERLRPGASPRQAEALLTAAFAQANRGGVFDEATIRDRARVVWGPLLTERGPRREDSTRVAAWLAAIAGIVLLLACSNVANLLLARAIRRRREIALRVALGVSRGRLFAQLLGEGLFLSIAGGVLGLAIALAGSRGLWAFLLPTLAPSERVFDGRVMTFAAIAAFAVGVLASLAPGLFALRQDIAALIKLGGGDGTSRRPGVRTVLLAGQCALSTTLLLGAGLFIRSLQYARATPLGFDAPALLTVTADRRDPAPRAGGMADFYRQLAERLRSVPGVINATTTIQIPFSLSSATSFAVPGVDSASLARIDPIRMNPVGTDYFATMGTRILRGRALGTQDGPRASRAIVVSDSLAKVLWPGADPIGKCVTIGDAPQPCSVVVGLAENVHQYEVKAEPAFQLWFPESQNQGGNTGAYAVMVRVSGDSRAMKSTVRRVVQSMAPPSTFVSVIAIRDVVDLVVRPWRIGATVLSAFGLLGLVIAVMGLYSALAYTVSQRSAELGIRMALGATPRAVIAGVMADGLRVVVAGIAVGVGFALLAGRGMNNVLFGVTTTDPMVLPVTVATLVIAAIVASAVPAWRASRVDPAEALRAE